MLIQPRTDRRRCGSLAEAVGDGLAILIYCGTCRHHRIVAAKPLHDLFRASAWAQDLASVGARLRCRCGRRSPDVSATANPPDSPPIGPTTEAAFKALVRKLRD